MISASGVTSVLVVDIDTESMEQIILGGAWTQFGSVALIPWREHGDVVMQICQLAPRVLILGNGLGSRPFIGQQVLDQLAERGFDGRILVCAEDRFMVAPTATIQRVRRQVRALTAALEGSLR